MDWIDEENQIKFLQDNQNYINELDDISLLSLLFTNKRVKIDTKLYILKNYYQRIKLLRYEYEYFSVILSGTSKENINLFSDYLNEWLPTLSGRDFGQLLYLNFHYHEISNLYEFIVNQEWYKKGLENKESKYVMYDLGYRLEQLLNTEYIDSSDLDLLENEVLKVLEYEYNGSIMPDMIIKNYLHLIKKHSPSLLDRFEKRGYEIIDKNFANNKILSENMLIFIMHVLNKNNIVNYIEFNDKKDNESGVAYFHAGSIIVNLSGIDKIYNTLKNNNVTSLYLLFLIGHEYRHAEHQNYIINYKNMPLDHDSIEELTMYNCGISNICMDVEKEDYKQYHDHFTHEYNSNIAGLKFLYDKLRLLKSVKPKDVNAFNQSMLLQVYLAFIFTDFDGKGYKESPVEFIQSIYEKYKNNLPGYTRIHLLNGQINLPSNLKEVESNLSEEEKFELGYRNKYINLLYEIITKKILVYNIFEDIPRLYEEKYGNSENKVSRGL